MSEVTKKEMLRFIKAETREARDAWQYDLSLGLNRMANDDSRKIRILGAIRALIDKHGPADPEEKESNRRKG